MTAPKVDYKSLSHPLLANLPEFLKKPANYIPVQKKLLETMACSKSHSDPLQMFECKTCTDNMLKRRKLMKELGFGDDESTPKRYMLWKKTHEELKRRMPLDMYNRLAGKKNKTV